jgi:predicted nuclease with TOPRIM domain
VSRRVWVATKRIPDFADPIEPQKYPGLYTEFVEVAELERLRAENATLQERCANAAETIAVLRARVAELEDALRRSTASEIKHQERSVELREALEWIEHQAGLEVATEDTPAAEFHYQAVIRLLHEKARAALKGGK